MLSGKLRLKCDETIVTKTYLPGAGKAADKEESFFIAKERMNRSLFCDRQFGFKVPGEDFHFDDVRLGQFPLELLKNEITIEFEVILFLIY